MNAYTRRNELLLELGFLNYRQYLRSKLWKEIRSRKMKLDVECFGCGKKAAQVHHGEYHVRNLTGSTLEDLYSVCKRCHRWIEFTRAGHKRTPEQATGELRRIRRIRIGRKRERNDNRVRMQQKIHTNRAS